MAPVTRLLISLLAVLTLMAPAYAGGAVRSSAMNSGAAECGCCCEAEAPAQAGQSSLRAETGCGCSLPPSVPPTAPLQAPLTGGNSALAELHLDHAPVVAVLPLSPVAQHDALLDEAPVLDTCCRERLGVWLL
ncbi:MAG: hypothetical protein DHS20C15_13090 [Planctomycetota bacterium]|nr:MAG: hypothetical protein DHS20C15_13090 [Planctomycetota bacterium]